MQTAKDHTPALLLIADVEPIDLNSSGARNTSSYFSPLWIAIELVAVGNSLESITFGRGKPPASPK